MCRWSFDFDATKHPKKAAWLPDEWDYDPSPLQSAAIRIQGSRQTLRGFTLDGQGKKCVVGLYVRKGQDLAFEQVGFKDFRVSGLWMHETYDTLVAGCVFANNCWGNRNQAFGNLQFNRADRLEIRDCTISERGSGCYGIKMVAGTLRAGMYSDNGVWREKTLNDTIRIHHNRIEVDQSGTWSTSEGGHAPAIAIEFNSDIEAKNVEIHDNWLNNHVSIVSWEVGQATGYRIHHNLFDLRSDDGTRVRYAYMLESNESNFEVDHNLVLGGLYPIATWDRGKSRNRNHHIHHNIFHGPAGTEQVASGLPIFRDSSGHDGYRFEHNTVIDSRGAGPFFLVENPDRGNVNAEIANNLFISTLPDRGDILGNPAAIGGATIRNNGFWNMAPRGEAAMTADPLLDLDGGTYAPGPASPAIGAGFPSGPGSRQSDRAPDLGAVSSIGESWVPRAVGAGPANAAQPTGR